jgi:hypothetical protein
MGSTEVGERDEGHGVDSGDADPSGTVVVSTRGGTRFHRSGEPLFVTACRTEFDYPTRETTVAAALREGFEPCQKGSCFGATSR